MTVRSVTEFPAIAVLGAGSMGGAIVRGLVSSGAPTGGITLTVASDRHADELREQYGDALTVHSQQTEPGANAAAVAGAGVVVIAVKPGYVPAVLAEIADALAPDALVVTVAAGIALESYIAALPDSVSVARAMPNTPSLVGRGLAGVAYPDNTPEHAKTLTRALFETVGRVVEIPESQIDALSAVSGSGPAYFYLFVERMTDAAEHLGFDRETAAELVRATFTGSAELLAVTEGDPTELRQQVTSPGGTTMKAVEVLEAADWAHTFDDAFAAAIARAKELAAGS